MKNEITTIINVKNQEVRVIRIDGGEYISLTDLARYADEDEPRFPIISWMKNKDVISYLGLWESINNISFNRIEFDTVKNEAGSNKFKMSPTKWIKNTNAIGMISKSGRYDSGTYAVSDIAFLYNCKNGTKTINLAVKRNIERFPEDFYFQLTEEECSRFQFETLNIKRGQNIKYLPHAFTEIGVA